MLTKKEVAATLVGCKVHDNDDTEFLAEVDRIISGVAGLQRPCRLVVHRIDNWFGPKWHQFAGKMLGAVSVWKSDQRVVVPPFVKNRITDRASFDLSVIDDRYVYTGNGPDIHWDGPSSDNMQNRANQRAPGSALFWFSGNSQTNGRGSLMGYVPTGDQYWCWYLGFALQQQWTVPMKIDFDDRTLRMLDEDRIDIVEA